MAVMPIGAAIRELADRDPDRPSMTEVPVRGDGTARTVSRIEVERDTNRLARTLERQGVSEGDLVTIGLPNGIDFLYACIATWKLGAVPQPVSPRLPAAERDAIVALARPALVVREPLVADDDVSDEPVVPDRVAPSQKAPTSGGSTGRPKIILSGMPGVADPDGPPLFGMRPDGVQVVPGPLFHNAPFVAATGGLFKGQHVVVLRRFDAESTLRCIDEFQADWVMLVPTMMSRMLKLPGDSRDRWSLASLQGMLHAAAPCPPAVKRGWIDWIGADKVWELYAGTEGQGSTVVVGTDWLEHPGTVGRPAPGTMKITDPDGHEMPPGEVGEIWIKVPPRSTYTYIGAEARARDGWESLGDLGWMDGDGYLFIADRRTDLILTGGANVYPAEVEAALEEHPSVRSCAVVGLPDDDLGQVVHAVVELSEPVGDDGLRAFLAERLAPEKLPRSYERSDEPVRDDAGKVRRSELAAQIAERRAGVAERQK